MEKRRSRYHNNPYNVEEKPKKKVRLSKQGKLIILGMVVIVSVITAFSMKPSPSKSYEPIEQTKVIKDFNERVRTHENKASYEYAEIVARAFVADFYTLADKSGFADVGGLDYVTENAKSRFKSQASNDYYVYYNEVLNKKEDLPEVSSVSAHDIFYIDEYGVEGVMYPAVKFRMEIRYSNKENFNVSRWPTSTFITLILENNEWQVVTISDN